MGLEVIPVFEIREITAALARDHYFTAGTRHLFKDGYAGPGPPRGSKAGHEPRGSATYYKNISIHGKNIK